jgi:hypothetical protein
MTHGIDRSTFLAKCVTPDAETADEQGARSGDSDEDVSKTLATTVCPACDRSFARRAISFVQPGVDEQRAGRTGRARQRRC